MGNDTVVAVVPAFNPDADFVRRIFRLLEQVSLVVVVDDGSVEPRDWATQLSNLDRIFLFRQENCGIASAINRGVMRSLELVPSARFILTVDQDSDLGEAYVRNAIATFEQAREDEVNVGAICAEKFNDWSVAVRSVVKGHSTALQVAQSGMLLPVDSIRAFGPFDERFFIDCVETDFIFRMLAGGYVVLRGDGCHMKHEVGNLTPVVVFGRAVHVGKKALRFSYHSATRRYYITRNRVEFYRRYFWADPWWNLRDIILETRTLALCLIFGQARTAQAVSVVLGLTDGVAKRLGKIAPTRVARLTGNKFR